MAEPDRGSPEWWLKTLATRLHDRRTGRGWSNLAQKREMRPGLDLLWSYVTGDPPLPDCASGWREGMRSFIRSSRMNYADRACASVSDRLVPTGWRTAVDQDEDGDQLAAEVAAENRFGLILPDLWDYMLALGDAYTLTSNPRKGSKIPTITAEDPRQAITSDDPITGDVSVGLKMFRDEWDSADLAYLYMPGYLRVYRHVSKTSSLLSSSFRFGLGSWDIDEQLSGATPGLPERCAMAHVSNRRGVGEFEPHLDVLNRINETIFDRVTIAKFQAFRQRGIKGLPDNDSEGDEIDYSEAFLADPGGLWKLPLEAEVWESTPVDMNPIRMVIKDDVEGFAAAIGMPLHYVTPDAAQGSAEGASTMKESNTFRTEERQRRADVLLAQTQSNAFAVMGDEERANVRQIKTIWSPAERYSLSDKSQSFFTQRQAGMPFDVAARDILNYGPDDLPRLRQARTNDLFFSAAQANGQNA